MKNAIIVLVSLCLFLTGCINENDRELKLQNVISVFGDSMINKDLKKLQHITELDLFDDERAFEGNNFFSFETLNVSMDGDNAVVILKSEFEEMQLNNEYINLIGYLTPTLNYSKDDWHITLIESEIDPSTPRPFRP